MSTKPSKETRYRITDPYLEFWLRFVLPQLGEIERGRGDRALRRVQAGWTSWRGRAVEPIVREALSRLLPDDRTPWLSVDDTAAFGGYWTRTNSCEERHAGQHETARWQATAAHAQHVQPYLDSLAWRLDTDDASIVFTGDTEPCESVRELAEGADVLVAMCWDHQEQMECDCEGAGQMGSTGAAQLADDAGVSNLVLVHTGPNLERPGSMERAVGDIREITRATYMSVESCCLLNSELRLY